MRAEHIVKEAPRGQTGRDIPCDTLAQALQRLLRTVLVQSEAELGAWRKTIPHACGSTRRLLGDVVPELEPLIGPQTPVPELASGEAEMRIICPARVRQATPIAGRLL
jgi:predicted ATPase